ncbi:DUF1127 domain-containing protein [Pseudothauera lacus]|uniref:DUF1127 domain-containing protein n=1 Tax=Pseudothauera lacus TaxID=2136175 RepID=A0A2T4IDJ4_9RHOO|nr:DUF1127 domain-containing protein [Pseudothauera lacus]PTD95852.1 DUF1127 domain-containing protein [Pseudothauera lacus]
MLIIELLRRTRLHLLYGLRRQRTRKELLDLDARALRDIGLSREQAIQEGRKHFWQR